jgi:hypothetical protein
MPKKKKEGPCAVVGCGKPIEVREWCEEHYYRLWKFGRLHKVNVGNKRNHPLYIPWFEKKPDAVPAWQDFWKFVEDVGERPGKNFWLVRKSNEPWGPDNFEWREQLVRQPGESRKDFVARKWSDKKQRIPDFEHLRDMKRRFNFSPEGYVQMHTAQEGNCAICRRPETAIHKSTGRAKRLAVDHCHKSGKIRGLLCWSCNSTLGKVEDNPDRLVAMIVYLKRNE